MKKKILAVISAVIMLSACSGQGDETSADDMELAGELIGVWCSVGSVVYDDDGDISSFAALEFDGNSAYRHEVNGDRIVSALLGEYEIKNGEYAAKNGSSEQYAIIDIREYDGKDHLYWSNDSVTQDFVRMTDNEIEEYGIPEGQLTDKLLGDE